MDKFSVQDSKDKGRVMIALTDIKCGECIFTESPLVHASWHEYKCIECDGPHDSSDCKEVKQNYPAAIVNHVDDMTNRLALLAAIGETDRARLLIKVLVRIASQGPGSELLRNILTLSAVNMEKNVECVQQIRKNFILRLVIPPFLQDDNLAYIIGALNTNSHELATYGGSGIFLLASRMEHNCRPNCTFTPFGTDMRISAIEDIKTGDALSLDYLAQVYRPTGYRLEKLQGSYEFTCTCAACTTAPDICRTFVCPKSDCSGVVAPVGEGLVKTDWKCLTCGRELSKNNLKKFLKTEQMVVSLVRPFGKPRTEGKGSDMDDEDEESDEDEDEDEILSMEAISKILNGRILHIGHYAVFWALEKLGRFLIAEMMAEEAEEVWKQVVAQVDRVCPTYSSSRVVHYDDLAQICIMGGDSKGALQAYTQARDIAVVACGGTDSPQTQQLQGLLDRLPHSVDEMLFRYQNIDELVAKFTREGDEEALAELRELQQEMEGLTEGMEDLMNDLCEEVEGGMEG